MRHFLASDKCYKIFLFIIITGIILLTYYLSANWYQLALIHGESMSPAYHDMQIVLIDKHSKDYQKGDVIAFKCDSLSSILVKRIAALEGDKVQIKENKLYVNDKISAYYEQDLFEYSGILSNPVYLEENEYIVIGDNTKDSKDSRYEAIGIVSYGDILGHIVK